MAFHNVHGKRLQKVKESKQVPEALKEKFKAAVTTYLKAKDRLSETDRHDEEVRILTSNLYGCVENKVAPAYTMTKVLRGVIKSGGLENVINLDLDQILSIPNIGPKSGAILYELVSYCKDIPQIAEAQRNKVELPEDKLKTLQRLLRESGNILTELLREFPKK